MAVIRPFKALRPTKEKSQLVASVPYDVVNREEAKQFAEGNPLSYLHITRSEIDLPEVKDVYSKEVYLKAKENLNKIIENVPLNVDAKPHFYLYRLISHGAFSRRHHRDAAGQFRPPPLMGSGAGLRSRHRPWRGVLLVGA